MQHEQDPLPRQPVIKRLATGLWERIEPLLPKKPRRFRYPSGTSHGFALIDILPSLTTDTDGAFTTVTR
jgi:hypothetical protein